jgi:hypothetical protein
VKCHTFVLDGAVCFFLEEAPFYHALRESSAAWRNRIKTVCIFRVDKTTPKSQPNNPMQMDQGIRGNPFQTQT